MRLRFAVCGLPLLVWSLVGGSAWASHPLATDDAGTQGPAGFEAEFNGAFVQADSGVAAAAQGVALHVGITRSLDLGVSAGYEAALDGSTAGMGDPSVDLKWHIGDQVGARPAFGARVAYKAPQESPASSGTHDATLVAATSWDAERRFTHLNAVFIARGLGASQTVAWAASGAVGQELAGRLFGVLDLVHESSGDMHAHRTAALLGLQWSQSEGRLFSAGAGPFYESGGRPFGWTGTVAVTLSFAPSQASKVVAAR